MFLCILWESIVTGSSKKYLILSENVSTVSLFFCPPKSIYQVFVGGESSDENYVIACLGALSIIGGQKQLTALRGLGNDKKLVPELRRKEPYGAGPTMIL